MERHAANLPVQPVLPQQPQQPWQQREGAIRLPILPQRPVLPQDLQGQNLEAPMPQLNGAHDELNPKQPNMAHNEPTDDKADMSLTSKDEEFAQEDARPH